MPYLPDGTLPAGNRFKSARRSVAYERRTDSQTHLRWASKELGRSVARLLVRRQKSKPRCPLVSREVFSDTAIWKTLTDLDDDTLLEYADSFREGIPMATPVFDGAREAEIRHLLEVAGLPNAEKSRCGTA